MRPSDIGRNAAFWDYREHLPQFTINLAARENESLVVLAGHAVQNGILLGRARLHSLETFCDVRAVAGAQLSM